MMLPKAVLAVAALAFSPANALWPIPQKISTGDGVLFIDQAVRVTYNGVPIIPIGYTPPASSHFDSRQIVQGGVSRALQSIFSTNYVPWKLHPRNSNFEPKLALQNRVQTIAIQQTGKDSASTFKPRAGDVDESYSLTVSKTGQVSITAKSSTGVLHALETFSQLFYKHSAGPFYYTTQAPVAITDSPKYPHRGIMLDLARNYQTVDDIKRTIDAMAWNKLNRLHLHITDSQSWPLVIPSLPKLSQAGAYHPSLVYTPADLAGIFQYGVARGVEVITEIDMPGHIGVVDLAYSDLIVAYEEMPYQYFCAEPPCGAFSMNSSKVYDFLDTLFDDLLPRVAPYSAYFHTGGDELNANDSMLDPHIRSNATDVLQPLLQKFLNFAHAKIRAAGLSPFVWEEMVTTWNLTLGSDTVVQSWLGGTAVKDLAESGHKVIDTDYNFYYLDCGRGQWVNFPNGASFDTYYPFGDWCAPTKNWRLIYSHDPAAGISASHAKNVLGGELAVWSEMIDASNLDNIIWPRASAAGEVWWSGNVDAATGQNRSQLEVVPRLNEFRERMLARGVSAMPIQMTYCTQLNATACTLFP
ncbi:Beta-hexosaminidase [Trichoderma ghanense]|uniref:Beta-hexosaminidase n=1 Tax=Trichoderma ghanense TaxID=65468 RepID=A0ABY2HDI2_9HYPO